MGIYCLMVLNSASKDPPFGLPRPVLAVQVARLPLAPLVTSRKACA